MLRAVVFLASVAVLWTGSSTAAPAGSAAREQAPATFSISGRGWGHGVGMSQYGAYGFAQRGHDYARILAHYYPGTQLARVPAARVRVLLVERSKSLRVGSELPYRVRDGAGVQYELDAGTIALGPGLRVNVDGTKPQPLPGPLLFSAGEAPLELNGKPYRGTLEVTSLEQRLRAINGVGLEAYLLSVVPEEVPSHWPAEALKAQSVVARSYALAVRKSGPFDLYADVRSQVYGGIDAEEFSTTLAVNGTSGQALLYQGAVATTYFFSTSGGRTANIADVWPGSTPSPYLVSVPDPYDTLSPHHSWGPLQFTSARVAKAVGVKPPVTDVRTTLNGSGRVDEVIAVGRDGEVSVSAATVRRELGLRSTWFRVGMLALDRPAKPIVFGSAFELTGIARGVARPVLERRIPAGAWEKVGPVKAAKDGTFAVKVKPTVSTEYRLVQGDLRGAPVRVLVAPALRLLPPAEPTLLRGVARPLLPGVTVAIQRQDGAAWTTVATAPLDESGRFEATLDLVPGTYRARLAPGRGFAVGLSAILNVVP